MKQTRKCRSCKGEFIPRVRTQRYCSRTCNNRAASRRLRDRAKKYTALSQTA